MQLENKFSGSDLKASEKTKILLLGGLHIKIVAFKAIENLLKESGWTSVLTEAGNASWYHIYP